MKEATSTIERTGAASRVAAGETSLLANSLLRAGQSLNVVQGPLGPLAGRLSSLGGIFRDLAGFTLAGVLGGGGAFALSTVASSYANITDRLRPFYDDQKKLNDALGEVKQIANDTRQPLEAIAELYSRIHQYGGEAGLRDDQTGEVTELAAKAARLSGGTPDVQSRGLTQFNQALGRGILDGQDLRALLEDIPQLGKAIADGLNVPVGKLKELGSEGKLTSKIIVEALLRSSDEIETKFARLPVRVGQALTIASNNFSALIGRIDETTGSTEGLSKAILFVGEHLSTVATVAGTAIAAFSARNIINQFRTIETTINGVAVAQQGLFVKLGANAAAYATNVSAAFARPLAVYREKSAQVAGKEVFGPTSQTLAAGRASEAGTGFSAAIASRTELETTRASLRTQLALIAEQRDEALAIRKSLEDGETTLAQQGAQARIAVLEEELAQRAAAQEAAIARLNAAQFAQPIAVSQFTTVGPGAAASAEAVVAADAQVAAANVEVSRTNTLAEGTARRLEAAYAELAATTVSAAEATAAGVAEQNSVIATSTAARLRTETLLASIDADLAAAQDAVVASGNVMAGTMQGVAAASAEAAAAEAALAAETGVLAAAMAGAEAVTGALSAAGGGLAAVLGGPVGIALTATVGLLLYFATRASAAKDAADSFAGGQAALEARLGQTTGAINQQTGALRLLNFELARSGVLKAQQRARDAGRDLGNSIGGAAQNVNLLTSQGRADFSALKALREKADTGQFDFNKDYAGLAAIQQRNPQAFGPSGLRGFFGGDPADTAIKVRGVAAANFELADSQKALNDLSKAPAKTNLPNLLGGGSGRSAAEIKADAIATVQSGKAVVDARRAYNAEIGKADAEFKAGKLTEDQYSASIQKSQRVLDGVTAAEARRRAGAAAGRRAAAAARRELAHNVADANAEGADYQKLAQILEQYSGDSSKVVKLKNTLADIANLGNKVDRTGKVVSPTSFTDPVSHKTITKAEASAAVTKAFTKPYDDIITSQDKILEQSGLISQGLGDRAALMKQADDLAKSMIGSQATYADLTQAQLDHLSDQYYAEQKINDAIEERNKLVDIYATAVGGIQDAFTDLLSGGSFKNFGKQLQQTFTKAQAQKISLAIFGDPERDFRNQMTRGLNDGSARLKSSADNLDTAATNLTNAATSLVNAATPGAASGAAGAAGGLFDAAGAFDPTAFHDSLQKSLDDVGADLGYKLEDAGFSISNSTSGGDIVVTGRGSSGGVADQIGGNALPSSVRQLFNQQGTNFGVSIARSIEKLFGHDVGSGTAATTKLEKTLGKVGGVLGTALQGAAVGGTAGGLFSSVTGIKGSKTGSSIGGAAGGFVASAFGLPPVVGQVVGGILGGVVGGLFKKTPKSSATITSISGSVGSVTGSSKSTKATASAEAKSVQSGLQSIMDQLGGTEGSFSVSIGTRKKKFVVDTSGSGKTKGGSTTKYDTQEEAVQAAILDAINDGAVKGIRQGALNLLKAGDDLDTSLAKAVKFQNVFLELKQIKDPVGAAVDALNLQFQGLITIFNEAGASASDFASLQELYDLKRADAIKEATDASLSAIQQFINGITAGSDSPLNKATVYQNARSQVEGYRADLAAGKTVDQDDLVKALTSYQSASRALNGSTSAFFADFQDILDLANEAKTNAGAASTAAASSAGPLAASPFDTSATKAVTDGTSNIVDAVNSSTDAITAALARLGVSGGVGSASSAISLLAGARSLVA